MTVFPGPAMLGRGAVTNSGQRLPQAFEDAPRIRVDAEVTSEPAAASAVIERLRECWAERRRAVVELAADPAVLKQPEQESRPPWQLGSRFAFPLEQLRFLVWANSYDLRSGEPIWWHGRLATDAGAVPSSTADVEIPGVGAAWIDGGPRGPVHALDLPVVHADSVADGRLTVARHLPPREELARDQLAAVSHGAGAARVLAPAGSGKTRVLAARLRHLTHDQGVDPDHVTAVAYNNRAAADLRSRVGDVGSRVVTLHALGYEIVRAARPGVRLVEEAEVRRVLERLAPVRPKPNTDVLAPYLEGFEQVRIGLRPPADVAALHPDAPQFASVYARWRAWLADNNAIDFDEQIHTAVELLLADPALRKRFQRSCRLLLVDEFQDLSPAFLLLVRLLAAPAWQVYGVGDDDQTIYSYRNADPAHLVHFDRWFPRPATYVLEVNYRCPVDVVQAAATLLSHNTVRVEKPITAGPAAEPRGLTIRSVETDAMADTAVEWVQALLKEETEPRDIAILARVNALLLPVQIGLVVAGIPTTSRVSTDMLERTGVRAALAWLRLAAGDARNLDGASAAEAVRRSPRRIRGDTLRELARRDRWSPGAIREFAFSALQVWEGKELRGWLDDLKLVRDAGRRGGTVAALREIREQLSEGLTVLDTETTASKQTSSHLDDLTALIQVAPLQPDPAAFEPWLRAMLTAEQGDRSAGGRVQIATIHSTKGLEWDNVLVYGATAGLMPHRLSSGTQTLREEERRVFHVALTRGRNQVVVLAGAAAPSPFLAELTTPGDGTTRPGGPSSRPARRADAVAAPKRPPGPVAALGMTLRSAAGFGGVVDVVDDRGVLLRISSGATIRVRYGEQVEADGVRGPLTAPSARS